MDVAQWEHRALTPDGALADVAEWANSEQHRQMRREQMAHPSRRHYREQPRAWAALAENESAEELWVRMIEWGLMVQKAGATARPGLFSA